MEFIVEKNQELLFARSLEKTRNIAKEQENTISSEQIKEIFEELNLREEQLEMVFDYLKTHKIGIDQKINPDEYLSEEEFDFIAAYQEDIESLRTYSDGEIEAYSISAMAGERSAMDELINIYLPRIIDMSKLYAGQGVLVEDLIGEGNMALATGVTMLGGLEKSSEVEGALVARIMTSMEEIIHEKEEESRTDLRVEEKVNIVADKARELAADLRRKVSIQELVEETKLSEKAIRDAIRFSGFKIEDIEDGKS